MRALFDIETNGFLEELTVIHCAVVKNIDTNEVKSFDPSNISNLCSYLETFDTLISHNGIAFDFPALQKIYHWEYNKEKIDTVLMSRLQRPNRILPPDCPKIDSYGKPIGPHSVEAWGYRLGHKKVAHNEWEKFSPEMLHRCKEDVHIQHEIYNAILEEGKGEGWDQAHKLNNKLFHLLERQERYGWLVDRPHMERCIHLLDRWIDRIDVAIATHLPLVVEPLETKKDGEYGYIKKPFKKNGDISETVKKGFTGDTLSVVGPFSRVVFRPVDLNSNQETKAFLLSQGWEPLEWNTNNDGKPTSPKLSKDDPFEGIQGSLGRIIAKRVQCRHRKSTIEGWINAIRGDGRISAKVAGVATTGRLRHSVIVNVPSPTTKSFFAKSMRRCFIAQPGWVLVGTDSKSNQVRQLAARLEDPAFTEFVLSGQDIHERNRQLSGVPTRTIAKNLYYGTIFGAGDRKIGGYVSGGTAQGKQLKEEFFRALPTFPVWLEEEKKKWRASAKQVFNKKYNKMEYRNGYIYGLDGRPILVEYEKDICVFYLQSDESLHMSVAYCVLDKWLRKAGYEWEKDYGFVIFYHDEIVTACREEIAEEVSKLACKAITWAGEYLGIKCRHDGDAKIGRSWCDVH